ncbi:MAG: bifunctional phosphopantothenoylcysteine decarboxylase/phosphopantothenate--cysteine ligase CoaBC [Pseudomonadota bacterium]
MQGRHILLGITGGIAAYKAPALVRELRSAGAEVQVVLTRAAESFVTPTSLQAVAGSRVRRDLWDPEAEAAMGHIELARWADAIVLAPATADLLARLTAGLADDLLATVCLATDAPVLAAPAMNRLMWANPATQANRTRLAERGVRFVGPDEGDQACGETGAGRMAEPVVIRDAVAQLLGRAQTSGSLAGATVLVTAGPTREPIDPVRYLSNRSSGKMGFAVAAAARDAGATVVLVAGPVALATPLGVTRVDVTTAAQMSDAVHRHVGDADIFVSTAAVADYRPAAVAAQKMKKTGADLQLELTQNADILASVAALDDAPFTVGFAAETNDVERHARDKLARKRLNMIAANRVACPDSSGEKLGFDCDDNALAVYWDAGEQSLERAPKAELAQRLIALVADRWRAAS